MSLGQPLNILIIKVTHTGQQGWKKSLIFLQKSKKSDLFDLNQIFMISIRFFLFFPLDISVNFFFKGLPGPRNIVISGKNRSIIHCIALSVILGDQNFLEFLIKVSKKTSPRISKVKSLKYTRTKTAEFWKRRS